jgi:2-dehydro-3-deoxyphosphogluconate aldolase/(4S)-4-hydroxy-2-oxoglutarate aldolase
MRQILAQRIVPVAVIDHPDDAVPLARALANGGLPIIEVTFRTAAAEQAVRNIRQALPDILVGAGTLLTADQLASALQAGAQFGVAPGLNESVVRKAQQLAMPFVPGVATPTEVEHALALGCKLLKFFPADLAGGVKMLQALAGPYAHTGVKFIPLGGINAANAAEYLALPIVAAIGGSWLADRKLIAGKNWQAITELTATALTLVGAGKK